MPKKVPIILGVTDFTADFNIGTSDSITYNVQFVTKELISPKQLSKIFADQHLRDNDIEMDIDDILKRLYPDKFI